MKYDEFAFFNQQLAAMLREGVPLEGALRQLSANLERGGLRGELESLEADLEKGQPLKEAIAARKLPALYVQMVQVGVQANDLPGMLVLLADYYQRVDSTWTRLKGLLVYPFIVLTGAFCLSLFLTVVGTAILSSGFAGLMGFAMPVGIVASLWAPPIVIGLLLAFTLTVSTVPAFQRHLRWRLPVFKDAKLAQVASAMGLMLKSGGNLGDALGIVEQMETGTVASGELARWHTQLAAGRGQFSEMAVPGTAFPPLFLWLVSNAGEDLAAGFRRAAEIYNERATYRIEMLLYAALPFTIFALGVMIVCQVLPVIRTFVLILNGLTG